MKKLFAVLLVALMLFSCAITFAEGEPTNITFAISANDLVEILEDGSTRDNMWLAIAKKFMEDNPDINLEVQPLAGDAAEYLTKLNMLGATETLPDMFTITYVNTPTWAEEGLIADLTPFLSEELIAHLRPNAFFNVRKVVDDGCTYCLPYQTEAQGWFYNKALFDKCGLEIPETWEDFLHCVEVFKENDIQPIAHGGSDKWAVWGYYPFWYRNGYEAEIPALKSGEMSFAESKAMRAGFTAVKQLADMGAYPENVTTTNNTIACENFLAGEAAMYTTGTWMLKSFNESLIVDDIIFDWGPSFTNVDCDQKVGMKVFGWGIYVPTTTAANEARMNAVVRFMEFLCTEEIGQFMLDVYGHIPAVKLTDTSKLPPFYSMMFGKFDDEYTGCEEVYMPFESSFTEVFWNAITAVITGYADVDEALQQCDDWAMLQ